METSPHSPTIANLQRRACSTAGSGQLELPRLQLFRHLPVKLKLSPSLNTSLGGFKLWPDPAVLSVLIISFACASVWSDYYKQHTTSFFGVKVWRRFTQKCNWTTWTLTKTMMVQRVSTVFAVSAVIVCNIRLGLLPPLTEWQTARCCHAAASPSQAAGQCDAR